MKRINKRLGRLFFTKPSIQDCLELRWKEYEEQYRVEPNKIFVSDDDFKEYENFLIKNYPMIVESYKKYGKPSYKLKKRGVLCLTYRGIPVIRTSEWLEVINENKKV